MNLTIGYGVNPQTIDISEENLLEILIPNEIEHVHKDVDAVKYAINNPIGTLRLDKIVSPGEKIAIVTSDITRPMPSYKVLPVLLEELNKCGVKDDDITIVFALGSHRRQTESEMKKLVSEDIFNKIKCVDSSSQDFVHMGTTKAGTPVDIAKVVAEADRRICLANIEYHYFAGYSGGAKPIMPGVSTRAAIQANHSKMIMPKAHVGSIDENPVRLDLEEAISYCPIDFILNVVLDEEKNIVNAVAGDFREAHREGCKYLDKIYRKEIKELADIVIVSQGGAPKDLNLYQTQKALDNAKHAVKKGGTIVLAGCCKEGLGEKVFEEWITSAKTPDSLIDRIQEDFQLGGHKAAAIAMVLKNNEIYLVSELDSKLVESMFMTPFSSAQEAFDAAIKKHGKDAKVVFMPYGGSTLPVLKQ